jgi:hypothetical protein
VPLHPLANMRVVFQPQHHPAFQVALKFLKVQGHFCGFQKSPRLLIAMFDDPCNETWYPPTFDLTWFSIFHAKSTSLRSASPSDDPFKNLLRMVNESTINAIFEGGRVSRLHC